jgi:VIT1/CCC1 family predicted Fe2+/Mn2+ transporter
VDHAREGGGLIETIALGFALSAGFGLAVSAAFYVLVAVISPDDWGAWRPEAWVLVYVLASASMFALLYYGNRWWQDRARARYVKMNQRN